MEDGKRHFSSEQKLEYSILNFLSQLVRRSTDDRPVPAAHAHTHNLETSSSPFSDLYCSSILLHAQSEQVTLSSTTSSLFSSFSSFVWVTITAHACPLAEAAGPCGFELVKRSFFFFVDHALLCVCLCVRASVYSAHSRSSFFSYSLFNRVVLCICVRADLRKKSPLT